MKPKLIFDKGSIPFIIEAIGYKVGTMDEVLDKEGNPALDVDGKVFFTNDIIGIIKGQFITRESQLFMIINQLKN